MIKTAVLVDGGFYRKRAGYLWGRERSAEERADELYQYCMEHICKKDGIQDRALYRIFYYDCPPIGTTVFHPLTMKNIDFSRTDTYKWTSAFLDELKRRRKLALRLGKLSEVGATYNLNNDKLRKLCAGKITVSDLSENDFTIDFKQKGVDMRIGIDISSLSIKHQVDQIILISGDSDFVPAAKLARREGIDFILDPMGANISSDLFEHIDGLESFSYDPLEIVTRKKRNKSAYAPK